ncbi:auxin-induced protein 10A5-like [Rutidosis leptorrhynchoides]|uniref:auxin-induced protein 10A5-like n=1 Tax=Rutidosis leptorrhynchoides TaxID=125765 RepID=UPI003A9A2B1B
MSPAIEKSTKIHHIVRVRQMIRRWRRRSSFTTSRRCIADDVPAGHVAICVGINCKRFIVRAKYLNHPIFQKLLMEAEEEYGFSNTGPLTVPCEESEFEEIIRFVSRPESNRHVDLEDFRRCCHADHVSESKPLLYGSVF